MIRQTPQREAILAYLKDNYAHPTSEEVYDAVKRKLPHISRATVYKNLRFLVGEGLLREVKVGGASRFEPENGSHHHAVCRACGKVTDFESEKLTEQALNAAKKFKGMKIDSASTNFYGLCDGCSKGG